MAYLFESETGGMLIALEKEIKYLQGKISSLANALNTIKFDTVVYNYMKEQKTHMQNYLAVLHKRYSYLGGNYDLGELNG